MARLVDTLDALNRHLGYAVRWLALFMVLLQFGIVLLRYVFGVSFIWLNDGVLYAHSTLFMLAAGYTLLVDDHVRVDIFYAKARPRTRALIDTLGHVLLLFPAMVTLLVVSWPSVRNSWAVLEGSVSVGGIPASFLLKSLIPAFCVLVMVQALSCLLRNIIKLRGESS